jgi:isoquinoline 1-oxidoreductase beta subunit
MNSVALNNDSKKFDRSFSRRSFMVGAAGLTFAFASGIDASEAATFGYEKVGKAISPWVSIAPDGTITIMSAATEMGQGSMTSLPLIVAEELDADWDKVRVVPAPPVDALYGNPGFGGMMYTAGSNAVSSYFPGLRKFGAQVRYVLLDNAAKKLGVPMEELTTEPSVVVHAKSGRRLSYAEIAGFAEIPEKAPDIKPEQLKKPSEFRLIGKDVMRVELPLKVNGTAKYGIDVQVPGMLYGAIVRSPVEGGAPDKIDDSKAKAIAGVVKIVPLSYGAGVIAETAWAALSARDALDRGITWKRTGKGWGFDSEKGMEAFLAAARNLEAPASEWSKVGDLKNEMAKAASTMEAEYRADYAYHAQMEPLNAVASVSPSGDSCEIWCGTQSQSIAVEATGKALGIPREKVKLNDLLMGGGFGRRGNRDVEFIIDAVMLSNDVKKPVKVIWTREDDLRSGRFRPLSAHYLKAGVDQSGKLTAMLHRVCADRVTEFIDPVRFEQRGRRDGILMAGTDLTGHDVPHQLVEQLYRDTGMRTAALRGIGFTANKFAADSFLDEIALKRGHDPVAFRLELLSGTPRARAVVERVAQMADWGKQREGTALGFSYLDYSGTQCAGIVEASLDRSSGRIKVHNVWCVLDCGIAVQPDNIVAQTESSIVYGLGLTLSERVTMKDGVVEQSNFFDYLVPRMDEIPAMHIELIKTQNPPTGAGQMATPLIAPAIGGAIARLTGIRLRHTPFTPERVKAALA